MDVLSMSTYCWPTWCLGWKFSPSINYSFIKLYLKFPLATLRWCLCVCDIPFVLKILISWTIFTPFMRFSHFASFPSFLRTVHIKGEVWESKTINIHTCLPCYAAAILITATLLTYWKRKWVHLALSVSIRRNQTSFWQPVGSWQYFEGLFLKLANSAFTPSPQLVTNQWLANP